MSLEILRPPFGGDFPYEFMAFFATAADRIEEDWPDPAGLGPLVNNSMNTAIFHSAIVLERRVIQMVGNGGFRFRWDTRPPTRATGSSYSGDSS